MLAVGLLRDSILGLSAFSAGVALWLTYTSVRTRVRYWWAYALAGTGFAVLVLLVAEAVFGASSIPVTWRSVLYAVALTATGIGIGGIARDRGGR